MWKRSEVFVNLFEIPRSEPAEPSCLVDACANQPELPGSSALLPAKSALLHPMAKQQLPHEDDESHRLRFLPSSLQRHADRADQIIDASYSCACCRRIEIVPFLPPLH